MFSDWFALVSRDALDEFAESEDSRLLPLLLVPLAAAPVAVSKQGTTRLPSPSRTIGMNLSLGDVEAGPVTVRWPATEEEGEILPGVDG